MYVKQVLIITESSSRVAYRVGYSSGVQAMKAYRTSGVITPCILKLDAR